MSIPELPKETHVFQINTCSWGSRTIWRKVGTLQPCAGLNDTVQGSQELGFSSTCFKVCADLHRKLWRKGARSRYDIQIWYDHSFFGASLDTSEKVMSEAQTALVKWQIYTHIWWFGMSRCSWVIVWIGWHRPSTAAWYNFSREWVALPVWQAATDAKAQPLQVEHSLFISFHHFFSMHFFNQKPLNFVHHTIINKVSLSSYIIMIMAAYHHHPFPSHSFRPIAAIAAIDAVRTRCVRLRASRAAARQRAAARNQWRCFEIAVLRTSYMFMSLRSG